MKCQRGPCRSRCETAPASSTVAPGPLPPAWGHLRAEKAEGRVTIPKLLLPAGLLFGITSK